jgi:2-methylcitrate dehydratase PrpD
LAKAGFTSGERGIEGPRGFAHVLAASRDLSKIGTRLGVDFDLRENTYKPFPCGIVNHPTIDGAIQIHDEHTPDPASIVAVRLRVAPLVLDLCNQQKITRGLQGKFSVYHGAAVGLVRGKGGLREYTDEAVNDPAIKRVRESATAVGDPSITEDQAHIEVELKDGRRLTKFVEQSLGNIHRPLSDRQLEEKFRDQAVMVLTAADVDRLIDLCWRIDALEDVGDVVNAAVPAHARVARPSAVL